MYNSAGGIVKRLIRLFYGVIISFTAVFLFTSPAYSEKRILKVSLSKNPPLVFTNEEGVASGIYVDLIKHIALQEGWTLQFVQCRWRECLQKLENGNIDLLMSVAYTRERGQKFDFTHEAVFNNWAYIYRRPGTDIESIIDLQGKKIATVKGNVHSSGFLKVLKSFHIYAEIVEVPDYADVFRLIDEGKVSAGVVNRLNGLKYEGKFRAEKTSIIFNPVELLFATPKGENLAIRQAIDWHLTEMKESEDSFYYHTLSKWLGIYHQDVFPSWLIWVLISVLGVLVVSLAMNQLLRIKVKQKTAELKKSHDLLEIRVKERTRELVQAHHEIDQFFTLSPDMIGICDLNGFFKKTNPAFSRILGYVDQEFRSKTISEFVHLEDQADTMREFAKLKNGLGIKDFENRYRCLNGDYKWLSWNAVMDPSQNNIYAMARDITEQKRAEEALQASENKFRVLTSCSPVGIFQTNTSGDFVFVNERWCEITGLSREESLGKGWSNGLHPDDRERFFSLGKEMVKSGGSLSLEFRLLNPQGKITWVEGKSAELINDAGDKIGYIGTISDISQRKLMEDELINSKKLEATGILAGGIAHDFNNLLFVISGNISMAKSGVPPWSGASKFLIESEKATLRAAELSNRLITFSKGGEPVKKNSAISRLLKETSELALSGSSLKCEFSISRDLWPVEIDQGQIWQALQNIIINAKEAMPEGGQLTVGAENTLLPKNNLFKLTEGKYVKIYFKDQGVGISNKNIDKIFDPYFSTKGKGATKGTGLGLSISHSIIKKHLGHITVKSISGQGTTLTVYLPASDKEIIKEESPARELIAGSGKVLVMDDEEMVCNMLGEMLDQLNYRAEFSKNGEEAVEKYEKEFKSGDPFDVVILDLTVRGGMGGKETIQKMKEIDPNVKGIASSGYFRDPVLADYRNFGFAGTLDKPYSQEKLSEVLSRFNQ